LDYLAKVRELGVRSGVGAVAVCLVDGKVAIHLGENAAAAAPAADEVLAVVAGDLELGTELFAQLIKKVRKKNAKKGSGDL
jgi:hypothetical protein